MRIAMMDVNSSNAPGMAASHSSLSAQSRASLSGPEREGGNSRASSLTRSDIQSDNERRFSAAKPINDAVSSVLSEANHQTGIHPEVLSKITSQITANVLQQLRAANLPTAFSSQPAQSPPVLQMPAAPADLAHSGSSAVQPSQTKQPAPVDRATVYTPPSPMRGPTSPMSSSPAFSSFPPNSKRQMSPRAQRRERSPRAELSLTEDSDSKDEKSRRPAPLQRISTNGDATILERAWGKLFQDGQSTERLGQFLRGIAMHLIKDFAPTDSLVITPTKMIRFYEVTRLPEEYYPWNDIFDDHTSSISRMFRDFEISHHLVQDDLTNKPDVPALTPAGFEKWMILLLRAQPDMEFERLAKIAQHMPIDNPDDPKERFPKELSRRLFPPASDTNTAQLLGRAMRKHCKIRLRSRRNSTSDSNDSKSSNPYKSDRSPTLTNNNNYRPPYVEACQDQSTKSRQSSTVERPTLPTIESDSALTDEADAKTLSTPIERERKPYVAQPGGGKNHKDLDSYPPLAKSMSAQPQPSTQPLSMSQSMPPPDIKLGRSMSVTGNGRGPDGMNRSLPVSIHQQPAYAPDMQATQHARRRNRSNTTRERTDRERSPSLDRSRDLPRRSDMDSRSNEYVRQSDSEVKSNEYVRRSEPEVRNGGSNNNNYYSNTSAGYSSQPRRTERYDRDRRERGSFPADPRDRGREPRPRFHSISSGDGQGRYPGSGGGNGAGGGSINASMIEDDYYRGSTAPVYPPPLQAPDGYGQYPPVTYRSGDQRYIPQQGRKSD